MVLPQIKRSGCHGLRASPCNSRRALAGKSPMAPALRLQLPTDADERLGIGAAVVQQGKSQWGVDQPAIGCAARFSATRNRPRQMPYSVRSVLAVEVCHVSGTM